MVRYLIQLHFIGSLLSLESHWKFARELILELHSSVTSVIRISEWTESQPSNYTCYFFLHIQGQEDEDEDDVSTNVDMFISLERIKILNQDTKVSPIICIQERELNGKAVSYPKENI